MELDSNALEWSAVMKSEGQLLLNKYDLLPRNKQVEVADYIDFLLAKYIRKSSSKMEARETGRDVRRRRSNFGNAKGRITVKEDFDAPIEDFAEYM